MVAAAQRPDHLMVGTMQTLDQLYQAIRRKGSLLILPHNDPDPDAIASALALQHLLAQKWSLESHIAYQGIIGRAENKALVHYLGHPLHRLTGSDLRQADAIALVDTQPGAGNNALPPTSNATVVFDHHPWQESTRTVPFHDVRPEVGATSTMLLEYLQAAEIEPPAPLATALFYGLKTDTMGLARGASPADVAAYFYLQPRIDIEALIDIERAQVPIEYFKRLNATLHDAKIYKQALVSYVGNMNRPDLAAEMADLLLRLEGMRWVVCIGAYKDELILAVRARERRGGAGRLAQTIVGERGAAGGHGTMAGGQILLQGSPPEQLAQQLIRSALQFLHIHPDTPGQPLIEA
jgi:nanoRNase/pAp phosphatase (c-di-AMP/oligoRNAs hydrolase)